MSNMIERFKRIATILKKIRPAIICGLTCSFLMMLVSVYQDSWLSFDFWFIPSFLLFCWFLVLFSFGEIFSFAPELSEEQPRWVIRFLNWIQRTWYRSLGVVLVFIFVALIILSYQLLRQWHLS